MKKLLLICLATFFGSTSAQADQAVQELPIVVVIPSYNNIKWCAWNLDSVLAQNYTNFRVIYIDDVSSDGTGAAVQDYLQKKGWSDRVTFIQNTQRCGALCNLYRAIHSCADHEIICSLDGDDALAHPGVLARVNREYQNSNVWLTYGEYMEWPTQKTNMCRAIPTDVIQHNTFRSLPVIYSHLRTFYAGLFKCIRKEDLLYEGKFFEMTWDMAMMLPMLEMAGERHRFIPEVLYLYNRMNVISDCYKNQKLQEHLARVIRKMQPYSRLNASAASWVKA